MAKKSQHFEFRSLAHEPPLWSHRNRAPLSSGWKLAGAIAIALGFAALAIERKATASASTPQP